MAAHSRLARGMANILILGGTQWLGRIIAEQALAAGHAVTALARGESGEFPAGVTAVVSDRDQAGAYDSVAAGTWDLVVELTRWPAHAAAAATAVPAANWAYVSSCSVYADHSVPGAPEGGALLEPLATSAEYSIEVYGEAKSGCEKQIVDARDGAVLLLRPGLIGGPGDHSGRSTYWPLRFAEPREPVLLPIDDAPHYPQHVQLIDVRDLAAFVLSAGLAGHVGAVNAVGQAIPLAAALTAALTAAQEAAGASPVVAAYPLIRMPDDAVSPWSGPRSLPLVLPLDADYAGFARRSDVRALALGLRRRPLVDTFKDTISAEEPWGGRQLGAGLSAEDEDKLLASLHPGH